MSDSASTAIRDGLSKTIAATGPITAETLAAATQSVMGQLLNALALDVLIDDSLLDLIDDACAQASESPWGYVGYIPDEAETEAMDDEDRVNLPWCAVMPMVKPSPEERPEPDTFHEFGLDSVIQGVPIAILPPRPIDEYLAEVGGEDPWESAESVARLSNFANGRFVAVARTAMPYMVREIRALRALLSDG